jgi:glycosyltransferase involved in cell wall biosynthesis
LYRVDAPGNARVKSVLIRNMASSYASLPYAAMTASDGEFRILFVGGVLEESECAANPICNTAGNKFQLNFIASLGAAAGSPIDVMSFMPAAMFPRGRQILYGADRHALRAGQQASYIRYVNLPVVKQATQALSILAGVLAWQWKHRAERRVVILYNVFAPHALPVLAARMLAGGRAVVLVADTPHDFYGFGGLWGVLERIDMFLQIRSIARFDGQISLTEMIVADFAPAVPAIVVEGGVDEDEVCSDASGVVDDDEDIRSVLFSGTLNEINGTRLMLDAFALIDDQRYRLRVFGRGPLEDLVAEAAKRDSRIEYLGFQPNREIMREQRRATVLLNPRPSRQRITRYTFPSKVLEYMLSARPVITTPLPGIPSDYSRHLFLATDETSQGLATTICDVCSRPDEELGAFGDAARTFVLTKKTWRRQGERVFEFVSGLSKAAPRL